MLDFTQARELLPNGNAGKRRRRRRVRGTRG